MKQHDFIPLITFRGWNKSDNKFVFGYHCNISRQDYIITNDMTLDCVLVKTPYRDKTSPFKLQEKSEDRIAIDHNELIAVDKDSLGIYTGKDDKNGTPIFCGVAGAKYGSDILDFYYGTCPIKRQVSFGYGKFDPLEDNANDKFVIGNQYEKYLKGQHESNT